MPFSETYSHLLNSCNEQSVFVKRFILEDIKVVPLGRVDMLDSNKVDRERANKTPQIREAYDMALSELREDF